MKRVSIFLLTLFVAAVVSVLTSERANAITIFDVTYTLNVATSGTAGSVVDTSDGGSKINCGVDCSENFTYSIFSSCNLSGIGCSTITLHAAGSGLLSFFDHWEGACAGTSPDCVVAMDGDKSVTAVFSFSIIVLPLTETDTLTVNTAGTGAGSVASSVNGDDGNLISCSRAGGVQSGDCEDSYTLSILLATFNVQLTPTAGANSSFTGWSGDCAGLGAVTLNMASGSKTCTATFTQGVFPVGVAIGGSGTGTVTSGDGSINCPTMCSANFAAGTALTLTATPGANSTFAGTWGGDCASFGSNPVCSLTVDGPKGVSAEFTSTSGGGGGGGTGGECTINGTSRGDVLNGTPGDDVICAKGGNDVVDGKGGNDVIRGGKGADVLKGSKGNDTLFGEKGADVLKGGKGSDTANGGPGIDVCTAEVKISCP
jgi:Ca2+-binding RTX toxin-like protein